MKIEILDMSLSNKEGSLKAFFKARVSFGERNVFAITLPSMRIISTDKSLFVAPKSTLKQGGDGKKKEDYFNDYELNSALHDQLLPAAVKHYTDLMQKKKEPSLMDKLKTKE